VGAPTPPARLLEPMVLIPGDHHQVVVADVGSSDRFRRDVVSPAGSARDLVTVSGCCAGARPGDQVRRRERCSSIAFMGTQPGNGRVSPTAPTWSPRAARPASRRCAVGGKVGPRSGSPWAVDANRAHAPQHGPAGRADRGTNSRKPASAPTVIRLGPRRPRSVAVHVGRARYGQGRAGAPQLRMTSTGSFTSAIRRP
jgi:hypothetical protein